MVREYTVVKFKDGTYRLCKILNKYNKEENDEAYEDMVKVSTKAISEEELLKKYIKKIKY